MKVAFNNNNNNSSYYYFINMYFTNDIKAKIHI